MKKFIILILVLISINTSAQTLIKGRVVISKNIPLNGASVYLNNTSIGTTTNDEGEFELSVPDGKHQLIVSFIGFETIQYQLNTKEYQNPFLFKTLAKSNILNEVVLPDKKKKKKKRIKVRNNKFFHVFKNNFLGVTKLSKKCKILNPEVLEFSFEGDEKDLIVEANQTLKIKNEGLGYEVYYDLIHFKLSNKRVEYLGYSRYKELKGKKRRKRKWKKARLKAYNGSIMHFLRSILMSNTKEEGFEIDQFIKLKNKNYPTEEELLFSKNIFKMYRENLSPIHYQKTIKTPKTKLDSALLISRKARHMRKTKDSIVKSSLNYNDISFRLDKKVFLSFQNWLKVTYLREKNERFEGFHVKKKYNNQRSSIILFDENIEITNYGQLINPLRALILGNWAFEKIADTLPLDYQPHKD